MRRLLTFFVSGLIIIAAVFLYAQSKARTIVIDWNSQTANTSQSVAPKKVVKKTAKQVSPIKILVDKNPVLLYYPQKITVVTVPGIEVRVKVTYPNGTINNSGTQTGLADKTGKYIVRWNIKGSSKNMYGTCLVDVSVGSLDTFSEGHTTFDIVKTLNSSPAGSAESPKPAVGNSQFSSP